LQEKATVPTMKMTKRAVNPYFDALGLPALCVSAQASTQGGRQAALMVVAAAKVPPEMP